LGQEEVQVPPEHTEHWSQAGEQGTMQAPELHTWGAWQRETQAPDWQVEHWSQTGHGGGAGAGPMGGGSWAITCRTVTSWPWKHPSLYVVQAPK
jgi:hypothetical protein